MDRKDIIVFKSNFLNYHKLMFVVYLACNISVNSCLKIELNKSDEWLKVQHFYAFLLLCLFT